MWEEGVRIYGTSGVHNNFPIKIYWGMNLMLLFGEKFNAVLWYVCSQIKYIEIWIKYFVVISLLPNKIYKGVCSQIKYV